jgi:hypothetical protein
MALLLGFKYGGYIYLAREAAHLYIHLILWVKMDLYQAAGIEDASNLWVKMDLYLAIVCKIVIHPICP